MRAIGFLAASSNPGMKAKRRAAGGEDNSRQPAGKAREKGSRPTLVMPRHPQASARRSRKSKVPHRTMVCEGGSGCELLEAVAADVGAALERVQEETREAPARLEARSGELVASVSDKRARAKARAARMRKRARSFSVAAAQRAGATHKRCRQSVHAVSDGSALQQRKAELLEQMERAIDSLLARLAT